MAKRGERSGGGRDGRTAGGDPYEKLVQANRLSHKSVERSLDRANKIARRASQPNRGRKG